LLGRIRHWNRDRGCEPAQLAAVLWHTKAARELSRAASGMPVPFITRGNNRHGTYGSALLLSLTLLRFELLNECSEVRRDWGREGVVVVLQALPDC
jgi:hypothetical protein